MDLFTSKQTAAETNTKTTAGKISNGCAITVTDLAREPAKGLRQVVVSVAKAEQCSKELKSKQALLTHLVLQSHVQTSVPGLIETQRGLDAATLRLQVVCCLCAFLPLPMYLVMSHPGPIHVHPTVPNTFSHWLSDFAGAVCQHSTTCLLVCPEELQATA